jgi:predicted transcriptional regulator of viral defense system
MIASKLTDDYFISHYSAAKAHGFAERYSNHVYISSMSHQRDLAYHDNLIKFLRVTPDRFFGIEKLKYMNDIIMISDIERTMIDIVNRPKLSGDWTEVIEVMKNIQKIDQERFLQYLMKFNNKRTARISGFLLDNIKSIDLENDIKERIMEFSGDNIYYMNKDHYDNNLDKEWNLIVPRRIKGGFND